MATAISLNTSFWFGHENTKLFRYELSTVASGGTSVEFSISGISKSGKIIGVRSSCSSTDYDVSIRTSESITPPSVEEIVRITDINEKTSYGPNELDEFYFNPAEDNELFVYVTNNDALTATGTITLDIVVANISAQATTL